MTTNNKNPMAKLRFGLWIAAAVAAIAGLAVLMGEVQRQKQLAAPTGQSIRIGGEFELTDHNAKRFSSEALKGRPYLVFFGFTHCPDICPTTLQELTNHLSDLGPKADELTPLFISVDPARDTPENLKSYLSSFDKRIIGLTGTEDEIKRVATLFRAYYEKVKAADGDYSMNHTASVYLFDRTGALVSTLNWQEKPATRQAKLEKLLAP